MEQAPYRPVRQVGSQKRISDRARQLSESLSCSNPDAVISRLRVGTESSSRDNFLAGQESDRGTRPRIALPGILQSNILSSQERRRLASGVRLEVPQPICPQSEIQDDYSQSSDQRVASRGLGGECRHQRRLLPHPHTQEVPTPTSVCCRNGLRVFQFRALPFGLTSALRVFTKVILPHGHLAHMHAVCLLQYLDDWILRSTDRSLLAQQTNWLLSVIASVGFLTSCEHVCVLLQKGPKNVLAMTWAVQYLSHQA